jgi:hypothetical protein
LKVTNRKAGRTGCWINCPAELTGFKKAGEKNSTNKEYQFWQQDNHGIQLESVEFTLDELNYMHNYPIKAGIVDKARSIC